MDRRGLHLAPGPPADTAGPGWSLSGLIAEQARAVGAVMPATATAGELCAAEQVRDEEEDFSAVVRLMLELSGAG